MALGDFRAHVVNVTADGRPSVVDFSFDEPLASPRYVFLAWRRGELIPWDPAGTDAHSEFPEETFFDVVFGPLLHGEGI